MRLNAGCGGGSYPFRDLGCDVNCDVELPEGLVPNFVRCDIRFLPFRAEAFDEVYCYHVLEHLEDPLGGLRELLRVAKKFVEIKVPHRFSPNAKKDPTHRSFFNRRWFLDALRGYNVEVSLSYTRLLFVFARPDEITVVVRK